MTDSSPITAAKALWQLRVKKRPFVLSHAINSRCNMSCSFCEYWKEQGEEMSLEDIYRLLDEARSFGIQYYNAWTVEPLLRDDLPLILEYAKKLGMTTSLITNGKLLEKKVGDLKHLDYLSVSVDGTKSYKQIRGIELDRILPGIKKAREELGKPLLMNCVISGKNLDDIEELVHLAKELECKVSFEPLHEFTGIEKKVWDGIGVQDMEKYHNTLDKLIRMKREGYPIINSITYLTMVKNLDMDYKCRASDIILNVTADGSIEHCRVKREKLGNFRDGIKSVWDSSKEQRKDITDKCNGCLFFGYTENSLMQEFKLEVMKNYDWK